MNYLGMKKYIADLKIKENLRLNPNYYLLKLTQDAKFPLMLPGQFVEMRVDDSPETFLRRPISIHFVDKEKNELWLLIRIAGKGTLKISTLQSGDRLNLIYPLGNGFSLPKGENKEKKLLLIGGGVGTAPLLFWGTHLKSLGYHPVFLLGAKSSDDLLQLDMFASCGELYITTEDGSTGEKGFVIHHSLLKDNDFGMIYTCGPKPMMMAVAAYAKTAKIPCEVSLENTMACGIGACLCCVENTCEGNVCVCKEGPVFNIEKLTWQV
jgi:dihydroorotate dehydrogenase electron transfer subunit